MGGTCVYVYRMCNYYNTKYFTKSNATLKKKHLKKIGNLNGKIYHAH